MMKGLPISAPAELPLSPASKTRLRAAFGAVRREKLIKSVLRILPTLVGCALIGANATKIHAQEQTKDQQACINAISKGAWKVLSTKGKQTGKCQKDGANGKLTGTIQECIDADEKEKVEKAKNKLLTDEGKKCNTAPEFAAGSVGLDAANANATGVDRALSLVSCLFGADIDAGTIAKATSKEQAGCQQGVLKAVQKCVDAKVKEFNKCKKLGLKGSTPPGIIDGAQDLQGLCFQAIIDDVKGKIAKACVGVTGKGIDGALSKKCLGKGVTGPALDAAFLGMAPPVDSTVLDQVAECEVCVHLNTVDGLDRDCDLFDDGVANGSCALCLELADLVDQATPAEVCVPPSSTAGFGAEIDICPVSNCEGGSAGCAVTLNPTSITSDLLAGTAQLQGNVDASGFVFNVTVFLSTDTCTATTATADVDIDIQVAYVSAGPSSVIVDAIESVTATTSNESVTLSGGVLCAFADFSTDILVPTLADQIEAVVKSLLVSTLVGAEICVGSGSTLCSNLLSPGPECGANTSCSPTGSGIAVCSAAGIGTQGSPCTLSSDCAPAHGCIFTGISSECLQWCTGSPDCPGGTTCNLFSPPLLLDGQEWGACL